jgi:hypothetical protein
MFYVSIGSVHVGNFNSEHHQKMEEEEEKKEEKKMRNCLCSELSSTQDIWRAEM